MASVPPPQTPEWIAEFKKRSALIDVFELAFDNSVSDHDVRQALIKTSEAFSEMFVQPKP